MDPELDKLIQLQRAATEFRKVEAELAEVPRQKAHLDATLAEERAHLEAAQESLDSCQKSRRRHEGELQDLETRRSRYKEQLMAVKTNREYTAMLHEIETVEREIREREDQILEEMEQAEVLAAELEVAGGRPRLTPWSSALRHSGRPCGAWAPNGTPSRPRSQRRMWSFSGGSRSSGVTPSPAPWTGRAAPAT